ncbi:B12-binding domain-containing radical SAM protein [bacterium]|nr:MAG: B12-binding domain-containing radical SAM protein [bacterium]
MDILMVSTNRANEPVTVMPYGACITARAAKRAGHKVRFLDLMFAADPARALESALAGFSPEVVGLSVRNIDNNSLLDLKEYFRELPPLMEIIRRSSRAKVILGGAAVGVMAEPLLRLTGADGAVTGDGECVFPKLLLALEGGKSPENIPGVAWRHGDEIKTSAAVCYPLDPELVDPGWEEWIDLPAYRSRMAPVPVQSKRGCPFGCVYCTYGIREGKEYRLLPPKAVATAVKGLAQRGMRDIEFVDNVFNSPYDHALELCAELASANHGASIQSVELNPSFVDGELLSAMEAAGFTGIGVTAESAADRVLQGLGKGYGEERLGRAAEAIRKSGLPCFWIFMLGGPGETRETVETTFTFAKRVLRPRDVAFFNFGIRIYPGTKLESIARREGVLETPAKEMLPAHFYFSPEVERGWAASRLNEVAAEKMNILNSTSLSHPWLPAISRLCNRLPLPRPLWRHTRLIRTALKLLGNDIPQKRTVQ